MRTGRPKSFTISIDEQQRTQLESFARSRSLPHALARRAKIILLAADGLSNSAIGEKLDVSNPTVTKWCRRFSEHAATRAPVGRLCPEAPKPRIPGSRSRSYPATAPITFGAR